MVRILGHNVECAAHVQRICDERWSESQQLEFKREIDVTSKNRIGADVTKCVVALANHLGGHVIIGVDELDNRAVSISTIPNCIKTADDLGRKFRDQIDPPVRGLVVSPILSDAAGSGVIVIEVPQSIWGPHRSRFDKEIYQRSGIESRPLNMTEINRLVLSFEKREDRVEKKFIAMQSPLGHHFNARHGKLHIRAAAVPLVDISVDLNRAPAVKFSAVHMKADDGAQFNLHELPSTSDRRILRGKWREWVMEGRNYRSLWHENGSMALILYVGDHPASLVYASDFVSTTYSLLVAIDNSALNADSLRTEYGIEFEFGSAVDAEILRFDAPNKISLGGHGKFVMPTRTNGTKHLLPRYSYLPSDETSKLAVINSVWTDVWNSLGTEPPNQILNVSGAAPSS